VNPSAAKLGFSEISAKKCVTCDILFLLQSKNISATNGCVAATFRISARTYVAIADLCGDFDVF
jgi:hypothetical protein